MQKIHNSIRKEFESVRLFGDDIRKIIEIMNEAGLSQITLKTNTHRYDDHEIGIIREPERLIGITSESLPFHLSIDFDGSGGGHVYSSDDSLLAEGAVEKILRLLKIRRRSLGFLMNSWLIPLAMSGPLLIGFFGLNHLPVWAVLSLDTIAISWLALFVFGLKNIIALQTKAELPNFWKRKRDDIVTILITSVILIPLTAVITLLINRSFEPSNIPLEENMSASPIPIEKP